MRKINIASWVNINIDHFSKACRKENKKISKKFYQ